MVLRNQTENEVIPSDIVHIDLLECFMFAIANSTLNVKIEKVKKLLSSELEEGKKGRFKKGEDKKFKSWVGNFKHELSLYILKLSPKAATSAFARKCI